MHGHFGFELHVPLWCLMASTACLEFLLPSVLTPRWIMRDFFFAYLQTSLVLLLVYSFCWGGDGGKRVGDSNTVWLKCISMMSSWGWDNADKKEADNSHIIEKLSIKKLINWIKLVAITDFFTLGFYYYTVWNICIPRTSHFKNNIYLLKLKSDQLAVNLKSE